MFNLGIFKAKKKNCAFFDLDLTLYNGSSTSNFYFFLAEQGLAPKTVFSQTQKIYLSYRLGRTSYAETVKKILQLTGSVLQNQAQKTIENWQKKFISEKNHFFPWTKDLLHLLKENNYQTYLVSAAAEPPVSAAAEFLGIDRFFSSSFEVKNGIYTGQIKTILNNQEKKKLVQKFSGRFRRGKKLGFGDSVGDMAMLSSVDTAFVYEPRSKKLIKTAKEKSWFIVNRETIMETVAKNL